MRLNEEEHSLIHMSLELMMSSCDQTLEKYKDLEEDEIEMVRSLKEEAVELRDRFGRRYGK